MSRKFLPKLDEAQDDFFGGVKSNVRFAIRDKAGQLILTTKRIDEEQPMISNSSVSGDGTDILGEMIYTTFVPKYTNPATFEVLQMEAFVFDLFETEVNTAHL